MKTPLLIHPLFHMKASFLCNELKDEIAGIGITHPEDPFYLIDLVLCEGVYSTSYCDVEADDHARCVLRAMDKGWDPPVQTVWFHTHPFNSCKPSGTDETTFTNLFRERPLITQLILCRTGEYYAATRALIQGRTDHIRIEHDASVYTYTSKEAFTFDPNALSEEAKACCRSRAVTQYTGYYAGQYHGSHHGSYYNPDDGDNSATPLRANRKYSQNPNGSFSWKDKNGTEIIEQGEDFVVTSEDSEIFDETLAEWVPKESFNSPEIEARRAANPKWSENHARRLAQVHAKLFYRGVPIANALGRKHDWKEWVALIRKCHAHLIATNQKEYPVSFTAQALPHPIKEKLVGYVAGLREETKPTS